MLGFVYWYDATDSSHESVFNHATVAGCVVGMVVFGILADLLGRRKVYGYGTVVLMVGTMGLVLSSTGYVPLDQANSENLGSIDFSSFGSMDIQSWLLFFRFISGVGVGSSYPLDSVIASEYAPTLWRPWMLAMVFSMQSFGIAAAALVSLVTTSIVQARNLPYDPAHPGASARAVDQIWRWTTGLALIPALFTAIMRFTIPESPRYTLDVLNDPCKASEDTDKLRGHRPGAVIRNEAVQTTHSQYSEPKIVEAGMDQVSIVRQDTADGPQSPTIRQYFWNEGNWRYLFTTSFSWLTVDFATFALGLNETSTLSKFWYGPRVLVQHHKIWDSNTVDPNASIYSVLISNSVHLLAIESMATITGAMLLVFFISRLNRRLLTWVMSIVTGVLLMVTGVVLLETIGTEDVGINAALYAVDKFAEVFSLGPLTFMIPAELFPTKYRASCQGISAAFGKLGAILASLLLSYVTFGAGDSKVTSSSSPTAWLSYVFMIFAVPRFLGAAVCWLWLPELQEPSGKSKTLEQLALGRRGAATAAAAADSDDP